MGNQISKEIEKKALRAIESSSVSLTPRNLQLWQAHFMGQNKNLSADINRHFHAAGDVDDDACTRLYQQYFSHKTVARNIHNTLSELETSLSEKIQSLSVLLDSDNIISDTSLRNGKAAEMVNDALERLVKVSHDIRDSHHGLQEQMELAEASISSLRRMNVHGRQFNELDPKTGVPSRSVFDERILRYALDQHAENHMSLMILRLSDNQYPDQDIFDQISYETAAVINDNIKGQDMLSRFDPKSFAIILPMTTLTFAEALAQKIRRALTEKFHADNFQIEKGPLVSIGVAEFAYPEVPTKLVERAEACAKRAEKLKLDHILCEDSPEMQGMGLSKNEFTLHY